MNKTVNSAKFYGVKDLIVAGDITGKVLVPILERLVMHPRLRPARGEL